MLRLFNLLKKPEKIPTAVSSKETLSKFLIKTNEMFKLFFNNFSWFVYIIAGCLILCSIYYYICDCKRRLSVRRRREDLQRENARTPQRRRPGAIYREHEIFRNVLKTVHQYVGPNELQGGAKTKSYVLKKTRSGRIYGSFTEEN